MIHVTEIDHFPDLLPFRDVWGELLEQTPGANFFQSFDWLEAYWSHYGRDQRLRVLLVHAGARLAGILPLVVCRERTRVGRLRFLAYPLDNWGVFYGPVGPDPERVLAAGFEHIRQTPRDWDALELRWVDADGADEGRTAAALEKAGLRACRTVWDRTAVVDLSCGTWEDYFAARGAKWRNNFRRWQRRLNEQGDVEHVRHRPGGAKCGDDDPRWDLYDACEEVARLSWQGSSTTGTTLCHDSVRPFLCDAHAAAARAGAVDLNLLRVAGRPVAFAYNYVHSGRVFGLRVGYDPALARYGVGNVLYGHAIRSSFERGDTLYDLGPGSLEIKRHLQTDLRTIYRFSHFPSSNVRGQLVRLKRWWDAGSGDEPEPEVADPASAS